METKETFETLEPFPIKDFTLFGADEQPVQLQELAEVELQDVKLRRRIKAIARRNAWRKFLEIARAAPGIVGVSGPFLVVPWLYPIFFHPKGGVNWASWVLTSIVISLMALLGRVSFREDEGEDFVLTRSALEYIDRSRDERKVESEEKKSLEGKVGVWDRIPEQIRDDVRQLVAFIASYDANVRLFNAEAKRAAFYVARGHYSHDEVDGGLAAMRETIADQKREIVETIASTDKACIALALQPDGERVAISANLEAMRERLNGLGSRVREELALEAIMQKELADPSADFARRQLAGATSPGNSK